MGVIPLLRPTESEVETYCEPSGVASEVVPQFGIIVEAEVLVSVFSREGQAGEGRCGLDLVAEALVQRAGTQFWFQGSPPPTSRKALYLMPSEPTRTPIPPGSTVRSNRPASA